jgi:hypothetical protein
MNHRGSPASLVPPLPPHEQAAGDHQQQEPQPPVGIIRRGTGGEHEGKHQAERRNAEKQDADEVEFGAPALMRLPFGKQPDGEQQRHDAQRDVHPEHQAPSVVRPAGRDQEPAQRRAESGRDADDRAEQPERTTTRLSLEELLDEAEHLRHLDAGGNTLQDTCGDEGLDVRGDRAEHAGDGEGTEPDDEHETAGMDIAQPAGGDQ